MIDQLKARARALKSEVLAVYLAAKDPRTPWYAKALIFSVVAYTLSPIDLIPDFIPVLGYLDDLLIVPAGVWLAIRLIPPEVLAETRGAAATQGVDGSVGRFGAMTIILLWLIAVVIVFCLILLFTKRI